jgi:hypothetical protein
MMARKFSLSSYKSVLSEGYADPGADKGAKTDWRQLDLSDLTELRQPLHQVRHLNTLLNKTNEAMADGGYLLCLNGQLPFAVF